jgi:hypothetical protein
MLVPPATLPPIVTGSTCTVVVAFDIIPKRFVTTTVKISPLMTPVAVGFCAVVELKTAGPLLLHCHVTLPIPVSNKETWLPAHIGPELLAAAN